MRRILNRLWLLLALLPPLPAAAAAPPAWVPAELLNPPAAGPWLCQGKYLTPAQGGAVLDAFLAAHTSRAEWEAFAAAARRHILVNAGLEPLPRRTPLTPVITNRRVYDGYSVENIRFQSVPGYWVTGNLYRPLDTKQPYAAVLHTHGHSSAVTDEASWIRHGRFKADVQRRAAGLARMGAVSLTIDMVGYGDSGQVLTEDVHHTGLALTLHIWNAIRALDFLTGLEEVDPARIGVTGHSGGGTQAFLLSALDERVAVCVPVAMVSSWFFGGCACESGLPIHAGDGFFMNNAMIAGLTAPRPLLIVSDGGDWTSNSPEVEYPFLQRVYGYYGAAERVANTHLPEEGHDYGPSKRLAMYPFMAAHLGLDLTRLQDADGRIDEGRLTVEDPRLMRCFSDVGAIPDGSLRTGAEIQAALDALEAASIAPYDLKCDQYTEPVGIDSPAPALSWKLRGFSRGAAQSAWRIQAAPSRADLDAGGHLLWDSGRVDSGEQLHIPWGGRPLASGEQVFWRVRVWDRDGNPSAWSDAASFTTGILADADWVARWIAHPDWLRHNRPHLGYRSRPETHTEVEKWIQLDLGRTVPVDQVVLRSLRHTVAERMGFPQSFKVELSADAAFTDPVVLADYTVTPFANQWTGQHRLEAGGAPARFLRVTANRLRELNGEICLAFSQIEVYSGGSNVAPGSAVTASDSIEEGLWSAAAVVDGLGVPGANPTDNRTCLLRHEFTVAGALKRAVVHVSGLGQHVLYLNGRRVGADKLSPGWTDTGKTVLYDSFDALPYLADGANAIGIALAGGMYSVPDPAGRYTKFTGRSRPLQAILQMRLEYADGRSEIVATGPGWRAAEGPTSYSHVYGGEDYDARLMDGAWILPGFDDADWVDAIGTAGPGGALRGRSHAAPPLRTIGALEPVSVTSVNPTTAVYDLGQNASIMLRIRVRGEAGSSVRVVPAELPGADGTVDGGSTGRGRKWWQYTLAGGGTAETWESEFFYHGARYLQVERSPAPGSTALPVVESVTGLVTHSSAAPAGEFTCSSGLYNRVRGLIRWAQRSNMASVLTDCPHRERLGWLEQYHLNGPSLRYEFDLGSLYRKTFRDMADAQTDTGLVPCIAPEYIIFQDGFRDSPEWGSALVLAAWQHYLFTGDRSVLKTHYNGMKAYFAHLASRSRGHLLDHGLGDWYDIGPERPGMAQLTPVGLTATATWCEVALRLADIATLLGEGRDEAYFRGEAGRIRDAFNAKYFDPQTSSYATGSQTANAMPLAIGMVPPGHEARVLDALIADIRARGNALTSGDVGHRYLLRALADAGRPDVIHDLHHQSDRPGYGFQLAQGATSLTEAWDANRNASQNHFMLGHIMEWFYHDLAGIAPAADGPGFAMIDIKPQPVGDLEHASARYESVRGAVQVSWRREAGRFLLEVGIPANASARVHVPVEEGAQVFESGMPVDQSPGIRLAGHADGYAIYTVGSGNYTFEARKP